MRGGCGILPCSIEDGLVRLLDLQQQAVAVSAPAMRMQEARCADASHSDDALDDSERSYWLRTSSMSTPTGAPVALDEARERLHRGLLDVHHRRRVVDEAEFAVGSAFGGALDGPLAVRFSARLFTPASAPAAPPCRALARIGSARVHEVAIGTRVGLPRLSRVKV